MSDGRWATYTVSLSGPRPTAPQTVDYATADGDYTGASGALTFPANSAAPQTVTVNTAASGYTGGATVEQASEGNEEFTFGISNVSGGGQPPTWASPGSLLPYWTRTVGSSSDYGRSGSMRWDGAPARPRWRAPQIRWR